MEAWIPTAFMIMKLVRADKNSELKVKIQMGGCLFQERMLSKPVSALSRIPDTRSPHLPGSFPSTEE